MSADPNAPPSASSTPFSLFDDDILNRVFASIGLPGRHARHLVGRSLVLIVLTWVPMAVLALEAGLYSRRIEGANFFADYAAYAQFLIALPLFIVAERVVGRNTREAARAFLDTGLIQQADVPAVEASHREVARWRTSWVPEIACVAIAYGLSYATLRPEFRGQSLVTWHTINRHLTWPGFWLMYVALPILNYWWLRLAWKIAIWTRYLYRMSRLPLLLAASHPDQTGGIGFISDTQAKFALVIFAYGISNVAAVMAYKIGIEGASAAVTPVWGPAVGFIIGAPLLFTLPLFMFTKQLFRTKRRTLARYREHALRQALAFEARWLAEPRTTPGPDAAELASLNTVAAIFTRVEKMRVVPFDVRSAMTLIGSTLGSVATALPLLRIEGPIKEWLQLLSTLMRGGG